MSLSFLTSTLKVTLSWNAQAQPTGGDYSATSNASTISPSTSVGTSVSNTTSGGGNELISAIYSIASSGNTTIDLTNLTDILSNAGVSLARVKGIMFRLLSVADDSVNGTNCSGVTIGNAGSNAFAMFLGAGTHTIKLGNGEGTVWLTKSATGLTVDSTHKNILITNNDSGNAAAVQVSLQGATT